MLSTGFWGFGVNDNSFPMKGIPFMFNALHASSTVLKVINAKFLFVTLHCVIGFPGAVVNLAFVIACEKNNCKLSFGIPFGQLPTYSL